MGLRSFLELFCGDFLLILSFIFTELFVLGNWTLGVVHNITTCFSFLRFKFFFLGEPLHLSHISISFKLFTSLVMFYIHDLPLPVVL